MPGGTMPPYQPGDDEVLAKLSDGYCLWMSTEPVAPPPWFVRAWFRLHDVVRVFRSLHRHGGRNQ